MFVVKDSPPTGELVFAEGQLVLQAGGGKKLKTWACAEGMTLEIIQKSERCAIAGMHL